MLNKKEIKKIIRAERNLRKPDHGHTEAEYEMFIGIMR